MTSSLMRALAKNQSPAESRLLLKCVSAEKVGKQPAWLFISDKLSFKMSNGGRFRKPECGVCGSVG